VVRLLIAYRKWLGWVIVGGALVLAMHQGWISDAWIGSMVSRAVSVINALTPLGG